MTRSSWLRRLSLLFAFALVGAACGGSSDAADSSDSGEEAAAGSAADVCPSPLVLQTDWFPEAEHGAMYELIGEGYTVDVEKKVVRGPMVSEGEAVGIDFEIRTGGPAIGYNSVASYVYADESIHLGYANTESQILAFADAPMLSVVAPLEKNPQMIMWDPATYPNVETLEDLGTENVTINVFGGGVFSQVFVAMGIWSEEQIDPSYEGSPARFVSEGGKIAQQGFASAEPHNYENVFEEWGKPVSYGLLHDAGFEVYAATIAIRPDDKETLAPCLELVVPMIQKAMISYDAAPDRANAIIIDAVTQYEDFWVYDEAIAQYSVETQRELGLIGNGPNDTAGDIDEERIQGVIDLIGESGLETNDVTPADIVTNEFIDESIGF